MCASAMAILRALTGVNIIILPSADGTPCKGLRATLQTEEVDHCPLGHSGRWRPTPSTESGARGPHCFHCPLNCPLAAHIVH